ncbi:MAG: NUDIX domain-containing protein [Nanoarchaeota archaeon]|nr:NUDIX domain-containing protein [Nanoarchaeota archaeon]
MDLKERPKVGLGVIVIQEGKVLLGKRKNAHGGGEWCFPGGHLEFFETLNRCAERETKEETGLDIEVLDKEAIIATNDFFEKDHKHYITLFVRAIPKKGFLQVREPHKCEEWKWFKWEELPENLFLPIKNLIKQKYNPLQNMPELSKNLEIEIRSFISKEQYEKLLEFFKQNAKLIKEDFQETHYFNCPQDLRIQKNSKGSKIWMKKGKLHDEFREEVEMRLKHEDFDKAKEIFNLIGLNTQIKWLRKRNQFNWERVKVCLDYTKGYGYIIELEKIGTDQNKEQVLEELKQKLKQLGISITPKQEFEKAFEYYKNNWRDLIENAMD